MDFSTSPFVVEQPIFMGGPPEFKEDLRLHSLTPYREEWLQKLQGISPDAAQKVSQCGVVGYIYLVVTPDNQPRIEGGLCGREFDCPLCAGVASYKRRDHARHAVRNTTLLYELTRESFLHTIFTIDKFQGTTRDQVQALGDAIDSLLAQSWFQDAVLGYAIMPDFSGSLPRYGEPLHAHWHALIIIHHGVVFDDFKMRVYEHMKSILGDRIKWDADKFDSAPDPVKGRYWDKWMEPIYELTLVDGGSSHWASSHEVFSCHAKEDQKNAKGTKRAFKNLFDRPEEDLQVIMPLFHDGLLKGKFGGVLLDSGVSLPDDSNRCILLPPQFKAASSHTRWVFRRLVRFPQDTASIEKLKWFAQVPPHISVEKWEEEVVLYAKERGVIEESEPQQPALQL